MTRFFQIAYLKEDVNSPDTILPCIKGTAGHKAGVSITSKIIAQIPESELHPQTQPGSLEPGFPGFPDLSICHKQRWLRWPAREQLVLSSVIKEVAGEVEERKEARPEV